MSCSFRPWEARRRLSRRGSAGPTGDVLPGDTLVVRLRPFSGGGSYLIRKAVDRRLADGTIDPGIAIKGDQLAGVSVQRSHGARVMDEPCAKHGRLGDCSFPRAAARTSTDTEQAMNAADLPAREAMEFDVVIVGAGPAGLAAAIRLKQLAPGPRSSWSRRAPRSVRISSPGRSSIRSARPPYSGMAQRRHADKTAVSADRFYCSARPARSGCRICCCRR